MQWKGGGGFRLGGRTTPTILRRGRPPSLGAGKPRLPPEGDRLRSLTVSLCGGFYGQHRVARLGQVVVKVGD